MMRVVICDDEPYYQEAIQNAVSDWAKMKGYSDITCLCFSSTEDLIEQWENGLGIDLLFLDIQIPGEMDGMSVARKIRYTDMSLSIVFVTNYVSYVFEGYTVNALRFLTKPIQRESIFNCLDVADRHRLILKRDSILIDSRNGQLALHFAEIVYIEAKSHYLSIRLSYTDICPEIRSRIDDFVSELPQQLFYKCHRSYIVNLMHIRSYTRKNVTMSNGDALPIAQPHLSGLNEAFRRYFNKG